METLLEKGGKCEERNKEFQTPKYLSLKIIKKDWPKIYNKKKKEKFISPETNKLGRYLTKMKKQVYF